MTVAVNTSPKGEEQIRRSIDALNTNDRWVVLNKTADYTAAPGDFVLANTTSGNVTITFPLVTKLNIGQEIVVKKISASNTAGIVPKSGNSVDGNTGTQTWTEIHKLIHVISDGSTQWRRFYGPDVMVPSVV